ncbi:hypothetical protein CTI12_AA195090 [Artemisia annua]|uniref:Protein FAR1-RELATED SEQUENCE n=1 Tax=Artemisia annua TaxID=35608 RepID=A0A2U1P4M1_ARTAN|nr:hypothetical protein CTI12_AA195090 [Artemisia annua]
MAFFVLCRMDVDAYNLIDLDSDPLMCSESTKTIQESMSLNAQDVETYHIQNDEDTSQLIPEDVGPSDTQQVPTIGMKFDTEGKLDDFFSAYAYKVGFGVRKTSHNHGLSPSKSRYLRSHKKMDTYTKRRLELNDCAGIPLNKNFHSLIVEAKGYENLPFGERECRNYIAKVRQLRLGTGDAEALRDYFVHYCREENEWLCSLFNDRKRWVPVYVKEIFWAGMSTTQRSESMNAFFDGYVNSKTSLRQFVEQYDNALKSKMEKENKADFDSLNSSYKLLTQFFIERQFHESYTNAIFKLFQDELKGMLCCNFSTFKTDGILSTFHVTDIFQGKQVRRRVVHTVSYNEVNCDVKCSCHLFEFRGIVCRHMMKILIDKDVKEIPSRYILTRWRKDIKHRHYYATNCYDEFKSGEQAKQFDQLCGNFYEAAHIANSQEKYQYLMECINVVKEQLTDDSNWGERHVTESTKKLLLPLKVNPTLVDIANTTSSHATISPDGDSLICNYSLDLNHFRLKSTMVEACGVNWVQKMCLIKLLLCFCQSSVSLAFVAVVVHAHLVF